MTRNLLRKEILNQVQYDIGQHDVVQDDVVALQRKGYFVMISEITSTKNPRIKDLLSLMEKSRVRREAGLFSVEGVREIGHAIEAGIVPSLFFHCSGILPELPEAVSAAACGNDCRIFEVTSEVYSHIAYREGTEGLVALFHTPEKLTLEGLGVNADGFIRRKSATRLSGVTLQADTNFDPAPANSSHKAIKGISRPDSYANCPPHPGHPALLMVAESVEKPGNIGALLRTADAVGADAVILCDPLTDLYNPNVIRASIGAVFTNTIVCCPSAEAISFFKSRSIQILTAQLQDSVPYYDSDMTLPTAIVFGTESAGLTKQWREASSGRIRIPMQGRLDSLNVSVSAAILCFEALRQRQHD